MQAAALCESKSKESKAEKARETLKEKEMCSNKTLAVAVAPKPQPRPPSSLFPTKKHSEARVTFATSEDASVVARALAVDPEVRSGKREREKRERERVFLSLLLPPFSSFLFSLLTSLLSSNNKKTAPPQGGDKVDLCGGERRDSVSDGEREREIDFFRSFLLLLLLLFAHLDKKKPEKTNKTGASPRSTPGPSAPLPAPSATSPGSPPAPSRPLGPLEIEVKNIKMEL